MEKIDIDKLGQKFEGIHPIISISFDGYMAAKQIAEKVNEIVEKINKLEKFTGDNLK